MRCCFGGDAGLWTWQALGNATVAGWHGIPGEACALLAASILLQIVSPRPANRARTDASHSGERACRGYMRIDDSLAGIDRSVGRVFSHATHRNAGYGTCVARMWALRVRCAVLVDVMHTRMAGVHVANAAAWLRFLLCRGAPVKSRGGGCREQAESSIFHARTL